MSDGAEVRRLLGEAKRTVDPMTAREHADTHASEPAEPAETAWDVNLMGRVPAELHEALLRALFNDGRRTVQGFIVGAVRAYLDDPDARHAINRRSPKRGERQ